MEGTTPSVEAIRPPRYLTVSELEDIVESLPRPRAFTKEIVELIRDDIKIVLYYQLETEEISPDAIPILKRYIVKGFYRAIQGPGAHVGITAAESVGQPITQATLKSFHFTGQSKNVPTGVEIAKELFNASPIRKRELIQFHFKNKDLTYEECINKRQNIVGVTVADILIDSEFIDVNSTPKDWWYDFYAIVMDKPTPQVNTFLRLKVDIVKLYGNKYTLNDIAKAIEGSGHRAVKCVCSPTFLGIVDIYADRNQMQTAMKKINGIEKKRLGLDENGNMEIIFLQVFVLPSLNEVTIKGIKDITEMQPVSVNAWSAIVQSEVKLTYNDKQQQILTINQQFAADSAAKQNAIDDLNNIWKIHIDMVKVRMTRVPISKIMQLLEESGIIILSMPKDIDDTKWHPKPHKYPISEGFFMVRIDPTIINQLPVTIEDRDIIRKQAAKLRTEIDALEAEMNNLHGNDEDEGEALSISEEMSDLERDLEYAEQELRLNETTWQSKEAEKRAKIKSPSDVVRLLVNHEETRKQNWIQNEKRGGKLYPIWPDSKLLRAATYFYAECVGSNYSAALRHADCDYFRTTCNNPHYILANFDIEATRNACTLEFYNFTTGVGSYINPRHLLLIPEFMNNLGFITAITSKGVSRQNIGPYALASFEEPMNAFKNGMASGRQEKIRSTSTCIITGVKGSFGTNYFKAQLNLNLLAIADAAKDEFIKNKTLAPLELNPQVPTSETDAQIANLKKQDLGPIDQFQFQGEEVNVDTLFGAEPEPAIQFSRAPLSPRNTARVATPPPVAPPAKI